jgi:glycerol-3-phosphate dehydrogenase
MSEQVMDIIVVGGGINGAGIAADASGRGLSVGLYEAKDFASATSSASSKLIHGGLRYLEHYEFRLVSEALSEREVILKKAPHIAKPMRFRLPHRPFLRPAWMIRAGLFLYDNLGKRSTLKGSHNVDLTKDGIFKSEIKRGFEYSDCWVDDARLVILNAMQAKENGAEVKNYTTVTKATRVNDLWEVELRNQVTGESFIRYSHALVNATGPWVKSFLTENLSQPSPYGIRLIKGSHFVVPRLHDGDHAYILQNDDQRIVFVIPYLDKFSIVGTTDVEYKGDPRKVALDNTERDYLLEVLNKHFTQQLSVDDIVWTFSGVRPLCDDESDSPQAITRDYTLSLNQEEEQAPLLSVFGGKLTTYRKLGESAMKQLKPFLSNMGESWTSESTLPGGENFNSTDIHNSLKAHCAWLTDATISRLIQQYGSRCLALFNNINTEEECGEHFGDQVYQVEIDYLRLHEFAQTFEDIAWRRTKLGLLCSKQTQQNISDFISSNQIINEPITA